MADRVTAVTDGDSRNTLVVIPRGQGLCGGAWQNKQGWCERAPDGNIHAHYHCEQCGVCLMWQRSDAAYCSNSCRQRAYRARKTPTDV